MFARDRNHRLGAHWETGPQSEWIGNTVSASPRHSGPAERNHSSRSSRSTSSLNHGANSAAKRARRNGIRYAGAFPPSRSKPKASEHANRFLGEFVISPLPRHHLEMTPAMLQCKRKSQKFCDAAINRKFWVQMRLGRNRMLDYIVFIWFFSALRHRCAFPTGHKETPKIGKYLCCRR